MSAGAHPELKDAPNETHLLLEVRYPHGRRQPYLYPALKQGETWHIAGVGIAWEKFQERYLKHATKVWVVSEYQELA